MPGRIKQEDIALVREKSPIGDIIGEHVQLRNAGGGNLKGLCPFHDEKSPSLSVSPARGTVLLLRLRRRRRRHPLRRRTSSTSTSSRRSSGWPPRAHIQLRYEEGGAPAPGRSTAGNAQRLVEAHRGGRGVLRRAAGCRRGRAGSRVPRLTRGFDAAVAERFGCGYAPSDLGRAHPAPAGARVHRRGADAGRAGPAVRARRADRPVPSPAALADPRHQRRRRRLRRPPALRRRPGRGQVPQHPRDADLQEEPAALRRRHGQAGHRPPAPRGHRRGLHRRDGLPPVRRHHRGRHLRHGVRRRARVGASAGC